MERRRETPGAAGAVGRLGRRAGLGAWPAQRVALAALATALLLSAVWLGHVAPLLAQDSVGIAFDDLSSYPTETGVDRFYVQLTNLDADVAYQVIVSSDNAAAVGIGACRTSSQTRSVTGVEAQDLRFFVHACAVAPVTLTAEVRAAGADTAAATVSRALTVLAFPEGAPVGVRGVPATRGAIGGRTHEGRPGIVPSISFDNIRIDSVRANWGLPDDGGHELTGYGVLFWKKGTDQPHWRQADTIGVKRNHTFTGLEYNTTYRFRIHACHEDENKVPLCGFWTDPPREVRTAGPPDPPHTIKFTNITANSVRVTWSIAANTGGVPLTGIDLRYWPYDAQNPNSETGAKTHPADDGNDRGETLSGLTASTEYELKMRSCNGTNDSHCSDWSDDHRFTTDAPTEQPEDPTAPPEQPEPPKPPPVERPGAGIADQMYLVGQAVSVVLPAASGGGHWTYTLTPALSNGLTFDPSSRTIAGTPQQGANAMQHTYTATKTANGATTIETSKFAVAVFNLDVWAHRVDKNYARRLQGSTFWGGVLEHWSVLEYALMSIGDVLPGGVSRVGSYWFQLRLPASAGFQTNLTGGCDWPAAGPRDTTQLKTAWTPADWGFYFVRCSLGSASNANVELWVRDADGTEALLQPRPLSGQAWHDADHVTSFYVRGTAANQTIKLVESSFGAGDGLFSNLRPSNLGSTYTPNAYLGTLRHYSSAGGAWTGTGATVEAATSHGRADVVIEGYWDPDPPDGDDGKCGKSIACMEFSGPYSHLEPGRRLFIEDPPHWGDGTNRLRRWVVNYEEYEDDPAGNQYLPAVLVHEFGHAIGLGHSNDPSDIMLGNVRRIGCSLRSCGLSTNDREGARALYTSTHHAPH